MKQAERRFRAAWGWRVLPTGAGASEHPLQRRVPVWGPPREATVFLALSFLPPTMRFSSAPPRSVLGAPERAVWSCLSLFSPRARGKMPVTWAGTAGAASGAALLATRLPGQPQSVACSGLQCLLPAPLACVGVTSGRTPAPVYSPPTC